MELLKVSKDKRALKFIKKRVGLCCFHITCESGAGSRKAVLMEAGYL